MRTTVEIPDPLFIRAKSRAAREQRPLKALFVEALEDKLSSSPKGHSHRVRLPLVPSDQPGSNDLTAEKIEAIESELECRDAS